MGTNGKRTSPAIVFCALALPVLVTALALAACGSSGTAASNSQTVAPSPSQSSSIPSFEDLTDSSAASSSSTLVVHIPAKNATFSEMKRMYDYDRSEPLDFKTRGTEDWDGVTAQMIEYTSAGCTVPAMLVIPTGRGPFPVVLCAPGSSLTNRMFDKYMPALARKGIASLAIDPPDGRDPNVDIEAGGAAGWIKGNARYVVDLRRGLDLLETLPQIESRRIGYVGHSWGASPPGGLLAGVDQRIKAYALTYGGGSLRGLDPVLVGELQDPAEYLAHNRGAVFLFQCTKQDYKGEDSRYTHERLAALFAVVPGPKVFQWVKGSHGQLYEKPQGRPARFQVAWFKKNL
jgi:dienelactone hydrolase